jgi:type IV secretory pathway TraG/TraD family ATPase VirD4
MPALNMYLYNLWCSSFSSGLIGQAFLVLSSAAWLVGPFLLAYRFSTHYKSARSRQSYRFPALSLGGQRWDQSLENRHLLLAGATGSGKSQCIDSLIPQIRKRGDTLIVLDKGGHFTKIHGRRDDLILAPLDRRSVDWSPLAEVRDVADVERMKKVLLPDSADPHANEWRGFGQELIAAALEDALLNKGNNGTLVKTLLTISKKDLKAALGVRATRMLETDEMSSDALATASSKLAFLRFLNPQAGASNGWSFRNFLAEADRQPGQALWMPLLDRHLSAMEPMLVAWLSAITGAILSLSENESRRIWLIVDEFGNLPAIQDIATLLNESRKYGCRAVAGIQSLAQLRKNYGKDGATAMLAGFTSVGIFRQNDPETAEYWAKHVGKRQIQRTVRSGGRSSGHSGWSEQIAVEDAILPYELQHLDVGKTLFWRPGVPVRDSWVSIKLRDPVSLYPSGTGFIDAFNLWHPAPPWMLPDHAETVSPAPPASTDLGPTDTERDKDTEVEALRAALADLDKTKGT